MKYLGSCGMLVGAGLLSSALSLSAATYYIDCETGNDANTGLNPQQAWLTIDRANQQTYGSGDSILLRRNCQWHGSGFKAQGSGTAVAPITLADYGDTSLPRPVVDGVGAHEPAVLLQNVQNWTLRNLELTQHGQTPQNLDPNNEKGKDADQFSDEYMRAVVHVLGLGALNDSQCGEGCTVRNIRLENLIVRDGSWTGIYASGGFYQLRSARFGVVDNLVIANVDSYNHHKAGAEVTCTYYQTPIYATSNVWVLDSHFHDNGGDGVMAGPIRNGLLEGNLCEFNGRIRNARLGCWTWDSENTTIQFNESHHNMTPLNDGKARDGGGFDLDLGTENGLLQYNWSHDNQGEGFLFDSWPVGYGYSRGISHNAQMRYNLGERDGKKLSGGITLFGGVSPAIIYNNTIYYEADRLAGSVMFQGEGAPLTTSIWGKSGKPDVRVYNNLFITNGRNNPAAVSNNLWTDGAGTFTFNNNLWWRVEGGLRFQWGNSAVTAWADWQAMGFDGNGVTADPKVIGPLGGGVASYGLQAISPAIDGGKLVVDALRGMGPQDALGATTPQGAGFDIGACEFRLAFPDPAAARMSNPRGLGGGTWRLEFTGSAGRSYLVESAGDLRSWRIAGTAAERSSGVFEFVAPGDAPSQYYRAVVRGLGTLASSRLSLQTTAPVMHVETLSTTSADFRTPKAAFERDGWLYWKVRVADVNQRPVSAAIAECELVAPDGAVLFQHKAMSGTDGTALFSRPLLGVTAEKYRLRVKTIAHADRLNACYRPASNLISAAEFEVE